jgi:hypothetical protein
MKTIETIATITPDQELRIQLPENAPVGTFKIVLVIDDTPASFRVTSEAIEKPVSFLEAAKDLIGCLDGLPPDLSTNKKYMEGFGRE